jgi:hypothetical protein
MAHVPGSGPFRKWSSGIVPSFAARNMADESLVASNTGHRAKPPGGYRNRPLP